MEPHCDELDDKDVFHITRAVNHKVLGQHAGELLLDLRTSFLADIGAMFGVLCMKTVVSLSKHFLAHLNNT